MTSTVLLTLALLAADPNAAPSGSATPVPKEVSDPSATAGEFVEAVPLDAAGDRLARGATTGTLLFSRGDCLAVKVFTASPYTHAAAIVVRPDGPVVYDSANGAGVRCLPLHEYLATQRPDVVHVLAPCAPLPPEKAEKFTAHLDSQLGRPYAVAHHVTGRRVEGLHCAEYLTDALMAAEMIRAERPSRVSPASLREGLLTGNLYATGPTVRIAAPDPPPAPDGRCARWWHETKLCTVGCCRQMSRWFLCR